MIIYIRDFLCKRKLIEDTNMLLPFLGKNRGYTLVELMITLLLGSIATYGIYRTYMNFTITYDTQDDIIEMQQNIRIGMSWMVKEIRMAGFDPQESGNFGINAASTSSRLIFAMDLDEDGIVDTNESIIYNYDAVDEELERYRGNPALFAAGGGDPVIDNVEVLQFLYLDSGGVGGAQVAAPGASNILVSLVVHSVNNDSGYTNNIIYTNMRGEVLLAAQNDHARRKSLSTLANCRNLGL